ncbi:hypothetical protein SELMODRAFT_414604 [Selaginella moellendorffii]|uniref:Uncharacterized protein n=1 Tax=Selaginella moellendorffii TaxID=88036 RepID=D8RTB7_SELML|nr:hypothetical protein SELMODRAFT_414604 [Selaginella moellendorffii]
MIVQVLLKERINEFDFREWTVSVACGLGSQRLRWLAHAACARMAYNTGKREFGKNASLFMDFFPLSGDVPAKYVPQAVRSMGGEVFHPDLIINKTLQDGAQVEVECSRGPESFTVYYEGKPAPVIKDFFPKKQEEEDKKPEELEQLTKTPSETAQGQPPPTEAPPAQTTETPLAPAVDSEGNPLPMEPPPPLPPPDKRVVWANTVLDSIDWTKYPVAGDLNINYETWEKDCAFFQEQFREIFVDTKLCIDQAGEDVVDSCFDDGLKATNCPSAYQLSLVEFIPALVQFASSSLFEPFVPERDRQHLSTRVTHLIRNFLARTLSEQISAGLKELHKAAKTGTVCMDVLKENKELSQACIKRCKPPSDPTKKKIRVPFHILLPFFRRWLVLGDHWKPQRASLILIYAFQRSQFFFGASYFAFMESTSLIKISDHAYLRDFLDKVFKRSGVAKPLYTTYEEKKAYLRSILLHE